MSFKGNLVSTRALGMGLILLLISGSVQSADPLTENRFAVNFQNSDVSLLLSLVAAQTGLKLKAEKDLGVLVTINQSNVTPKEILDRLVEEDGLEYRVQAGELIVTKKVTAPGVPQGNVHRRIMSYGNATEAATKIQPIIAPVEKVLVDERSNAILFVGSESSWKRVSEVITYLDDTPSQILIEARIVETSDQFLRDLGVSFTGSNAAATQNLAMTNTITSTANFGYEGIFGSTLDVKLAAAETRGDAKIISRPKVLTLNNQKAKIESGITINVKTLSTAIANPTVSSGSSSTGTPGLSATTGITTINAGLTLDILPCIVGSDQVRLVVSINNSQPDNSSVVDGIPAISNNAASTNIIVKDGETAIIAGLVKQSNSNTVSGVPVLSSIPVIGGLFRTTSKSDQNNELTIFLTPTIRRLPVETL